MPSPFPGMDPYLENPWLWSDFHGTMIVALRAALQPLLPPGYFANIDRYVWLHEPDAESRIRLGRPDSFITGPADRSGPLATVSSPTVVTLPAERREGARYIRIVDRQDRRVVTVIELLSPSNKDTSGDRDNYLTKRNEYLATGTNLVEIDLLRSGERLPLGNPPPVPSDYYVLVCRAVDFPKGNVWPFSVRDALPPITVPLNPADGSVTLNTRECLDRVYFEARYDRELDYSVPPAPPLREPDATWARELLAAHQTA